MRTPATVRIVIAVVVSAAVTAGVYALDRAGRDRSSGQDALSWARQAFAQAEALETTAREMGIPNPRHWAAEKLKQTRGQRIVSIEAVDVAVQAGVDRRNGQPDERFASDRTGSAYTYERSIRPGNSEGFKITIHTGYRGFLGLRSAIQSDLVTASLFLTVLFLFLRLARPRVVVTENRLPESWIDVAQSHIFDAGRIFREFVRDARAMLDASRKERSTVEGALREVEAQIRNMREIRSAFNRGGARPELISGAVATLEKSQLRLRSVAADLEAALQAGEQTEEATRAFAGRVRRVTEILQSQLDHLDRLEGRDEGVTSASEPGMAEPVLESKAS